MMATCPARKAGGVPKAKIVSVSIEASVDLASIAEPPRGASEISRGTDVAKFESRTRNFCESLATLWRG
jgi:hypothetical protein